MANISSLGVGSGLDAESIVTKLMAVERQPLQLLQTQESGLQTKLTSFGKLQSVFSDLQDAASDLASSSLWAQSAASSSDASALTVSTGAGAANGSYSINVQSLAASQIVTSGAFASSASTLDSGTLTIELGSWTGDPISGFSPKSGTTPLSITIGAGDTSLASIRDKINAAGAGVSATIINDASGARLSIRSTDTGAENAFRITATEDVDDGAAATGLSALAYDATGASQLTRNQAAVNARATINGIDVSSASNTLSNVVDGLTVNLLKQTSSPVTVTVASDTDAVKKKIDAFVTAFNAVASYLRDQTKYDPGSKVGGPLQGDQAALSLQTQLRAVLNQASSASSTYGHLSDIGISMTSDGTLSTDSSKLANALNNLGELKKVFATQGADNASSGFMVRYKNLAQSLLDSGGALDTVTSSLGKQLKSVQTREDEFNNRLTAIEARIRAQYQALDTQMATLQGLSSYVTQQITAMNKSSSN
jgi:flagellar hook-associated protein 2